MPPVSTAMRHTLAWAQVDPGDATGVFMATGAATGCNPGYFGAQFHPNGSQHLIFSMWDAKNTSDRVPASGFPAQSVPASPECRRNKLDGQGTGVQCSPSHAHDPRVQLRFGVPFLFTLEMAAHNSSGATWEAAVRDTSTGVRSTLGRIFFADAALGLDPRQCRTLVSNFSFTRTYSFIEYYGSLSKYAAATWSDLQLLTADGGSIRPSGRTRDCCHHDALHNETSTVCAQPECDALEVRFAGGPFVAVSAKARRENPGCFKHKTDDTARICEHSASQNLTAVRGPCPSGSSAVRLAGANIFDSLWVSSTGMNTCCNPEGQPATFVDAKQALHDASKSGIRVFRFFASLFGASGTMSITNETQYWAEFDELMDAIESNGLYCIPSIGTGKMWSQQANAVTVGLDESMNDVVKNTSSVSWKLQAKYFQKIVARYADRNAVLFWELGNELNLGVNLGPEWCGGEKCFDTDDMVGYTTRLVDIIKANDPRRPISSGFSAGRQAEWHMEHCPSAGKCTVPGGQGGFWGLDSQEQWMSMFVKQNSAVDIMSLHHYMVSLLLLGVESSNIRAKWSCCQDPKVCYFNATNCGMSTVGLLTLAAEKAASIGKVICKLEMGISAFPICVRAVANLKRVFHHPRRGRVWRPQPYFHGAERGGPGVPCGGPGRAGCRRRRVYALDDLGLRVSFPPQGHGRDLAGVDADEGARLGADATADCGGEREDGGGVRGQVQHAGGVRRGRWLRLVPLWRGAACVQHARRCARPAAECVRVR